MDENDPKDTLHRYLRTAREAILWKLDGLEEYDVRRPLVRTGTNLLGLVKHLASVELGYFGDTFGRPSGIDLPWWSDDAEPNADLWATPEESRDQVVDLYHRAWEHADETIRTLDLEARGHVPWWPEGRNEVTLHRILVHVGTEAALRVPGLESQYAADNSIAQYKDRAWTRIAAAEDSWVETVDKSVLAFLDAVVAGEPAPVNGDDAVETMRLLDNIYETATFLDRRAGAR